MTGLLTTQIYEKETDKTQMEITEDTFYWFFSTLAQCDVALIAFFSVIFFYALQYFDKTQSDLLDQIGGGFMFKYDLNIEITQHPTNITPLLRLSQFNRKYVLSKYETIMTRIAENRIPLSTLENEHQQTARKQLGEYESMRTFVLNPSKFAEHIKNEGSKNVFTMACADIEEKIANIEFAQEHMRRVENFQKFFLVVIFISLAQFSFSLIGINFVGSHSLWFPEKLISGLLLSVYFLNLSTLILIVIFSILFFIEAIRMVKP